MADTATILRNLESAPLSEADKTLIRQHLQAGTAAPAPEAPGWMTAEPGATSPSEAAQISTLQQARDAQVLAEAQ